MLLLTGFSYSKASLEGNLTVDFRIIGAIATLIACIILTVKIWKCLRVLLDSGIQIPKEHRLIGKLSSLLVFLPMLLGFRLSTVGADGATFQFGGGPAIVTCILGSLSLILFESLNLVDSYSPKNAAAKPILDGGSSQ